MTQINLKQNSFITPIAIIISGVLVAGAIMYSSNNTSFGVKNSDTNKTDTKLVAQKVDVSNVDISNEPFIGNPDAPVTIAYWMDFQCPFCKRFELQTLPVLVDKYVKTGKVKIVFKDFQFLGPDSQDAGVVGNAVWELYPEQYKRWHDAMYVAQDGENSGFGDLSSILELIKIKIPEIDAQKIKAEVESKRTEYKNEIDSDKAEGATFGISGTPGFIIGKQKITGAQPTGVFTKIIDIELSKKN